MSFWGIKEKVYLTNPSNYFIDKNLLYELFFIDLELVNILY